MSSELVNNRTCKQPMALASVMAKNLITKHKGGIRVCLLIKSHEEKAFGFAVHCRKNQPEKAGYFVVCDVASDSPAERSAVRIGDRIVGVDGASVFNERYKTTVRRLKDARSQLSMILLVADPEAFEEYSALGIQINALTPGAVVIIGEPPFDTERESSHKRTDEQRATSLEDDAESVDDVINYLDALPQEEEQTSTLDKQVVSTLCREKLLFTRLRRILRRKHGKKDDRDRYLSSIVAEREDCGAAPSTMAAELEEGGVTELAAEHEKCTATSNPTCGCEQQDCSLEDDTESADEIISYLDHLETVHNAEREHGAATVLPIAFNGGENLSTIARTRSVKLPLMERISRMLSRLDHSTTHHECMSLGNAATSLPSAGEPAECQETSTPTFVSTLSIRLKPAQLPQQNHWLYQLLSDQSFKILT